MELHIFIKESVREVIKGMTEAETDTHKFGINNDNGDGIEFDIAITSGSSVGGKAGISVLSVGKAGVDTTVSESNIHRLKFTIIPRGKRKK